MSYKVKLQTFEGPFDLLVYLLENAQMSIYDIEIKSITRQYLEMCIRDRIQHYPHVVSKALTPSTVKTAGSSAAKTESGIMVITMTAAKKQAVHFAFTLFMLLKSFLS